MKFTLAIAQIDPVLGDCAANIAKHVDFIGRARSGGADLVVFPELSLTGYSVKDANWDLAIRTGDSSRVRAIVEASGDIAVLFGGIEESLGYGIHNAAFFAEKGKLRTVHRKIYLPTYGMFEELRYFSPGKEVRAFDCGIGRVGSIICEDLWHLPLPYLLAKDGADVIFGIAASPSRLSGKEGIEPAMKVNLEQHRTFARLLSVYLIFCNRVGFEDGVNFWGRSHVVKPDGEIAVQAKAFEEDLVFAEVDGNELRRARRFSRHFLDDDPEIVKRELERITGGAGNH